MAHEPCSVEDLWAGDRSRVGVCVSITPKDGVRYEDLQREVFDRVRWPDRDLRWHAHRRARDDGKSDDDAWVMEATASCLASSGDESQVAYRVEGVAHDVVEECEVLVSAPCHVPFMDLTLADVDISAAAVARASRDEARDDGDGRGPGAFGRDAAGGEPRESPVQMFLRTGLAASAASAVDPDDLARLVAVAARRVASAEKALHANHPAIRVGEDVFAFREMGSRGGRRFDLLFPKPEWDADESTEARTDAAFVRDFATRAPWVPTLVEPILGKNDKSADDDAHASIESGTARCDAQDEPPRRHRSNAWWCDVSVVYSKPGAPAQDWHCDGRHLAGEARADFTGLGASPPYAVCVFCPLIDLDATVGFTQFWAGSHVTDGLIGFGAAAEVLRGCVDGIANKGGFVAYDYRTMHRGMGNRSGDTTRPVLQFLYARSNYRETKNYGVRSVFRPGT
ncbi:predicted protein [Micromonas commoda]|uniref:Phytanoyl-CoA dioxygenase n=1 Tax=Micromonas commoda (strain RCC299 / NOUM17 / CCMP2709) TaxID=296587 RepID=C1EDQ1_MICCC|nr:predicted protein [Micromonas commoda]ACO66093.1 predicted protein [Micromonas commoda]|eukprot:XP_002504835.1 predicted protein [Micromonas commoda]